MWLDLLDAGIQFLFLMAIGFTLYRGFKKNQTILTERDELVKRYLLFRGDKQVRLKIYGEDEKIYHELLRNISSSWKNFKKTYDEYLSSFSKNTQKTKRILQIVTLGLFVNTARVLIDKYYFSGLNPNLFYGAIRELTSYILVFLSFSLLKIQTHRYLSPKGEAMKMDRDILFFPDNLSTEEEHEVLFSEFDPLESKGKEDEKED
ncbi:MAG: hypothetical protein ACPL6D_04180 [Thermodesulfobacteriota bacterium]